MTMVDRETYSFCGSEDTDSAESEDSKSRVSVENHCDNQLTEAKS